jgi:hypothetical protein
LGRCGGEAARPTRSAARARRSHHLAQRFVFPRAIHITARSAKFRLKCKPSRRYVQHNRLNGNTRRHR